MKKRGYNRPRKIRPKKDRHPSEIPNCPREVWDKYMDELEHAETMDWVHDCEEREWKQSEDYAKRKELADRFAERNKRKSS